MFVLPTTILTSIVISIYKEIFVIQICLSPMQTNILFNNLIYKDLLHVIDSILKLCDSEQVTVINFKEVKIQMCKICNS